MNSAALKIIEERSKSLNPKIEDVKLTPTKKFWMGNVVATESNYVTDGLVMFDKRYVKPAATKRLIIWNKTSRHGEDNPVTVENATRIWNALTEYTGVEHTFLGWANTPDTTPEKVAYFSYKDMYVMVDANFFRFLTWAIDYDQATYHEKTKALIFRQKGRPVALIQPLRHDDENAAALAIDLEVARKYKN